MQVFVTKEATKQYHSFPKSEQIKIRKKLILLEKNSLAGKKLEGKLSKYRSLRAWPYRIIYSIDNQQKTIIIQSILHRQGAYKY